MNDAEDPEHWQERKERHASKVENATRAGVPLAIAAKAWPTPRAAISPGEGDNPKSGASLDVQARSWPTPTTAPEAKNLGSNQVNSPPSLGDAAKTWPTPNTRDSSDAARHTTTTDVMHPGTTLTDAVRIWPTPRAEERQQHSSEDASVSLSKRVETWPTPRASEQENRQTSLPPSQQDGGHGAALAGVAATWPTPTMSDGPKGSGEGTNRQGGPSLTTEASTWATPSARDFRDGQASQETLERNSRQASQETLERNSRPLNEQVVALSSRPGPTSTPPGPPFSPLIHGSSRPSGSPTSGRKRRRLERLLAKPKLNPLFVEWLMGWPPGWTLLPEIASTASASAETASSGSPPPSPSRGSPSDSARSDGQSD